jgi:hypothetical protein
LPRPGTEPRFLCHVAYNLFSSPDPTYHAQFPRFLVYIYTSSDSISQQSET